MNKYLPLIMVLAFWGIFLWGMNNPKVGDAVIAISVVLVILIVILWIKKIRFGKLIANLKNRII